MTATVRELESSGIWGKDAQEYGFQRLRSPTCPGSPRYQTRVSDP